MKIRFDKNNSNAIDFYNDGKLVYFLALPPCETGCDIININKSNISKGYEFNFDGLVVITSKLKRELYHKGELISIALKNK